MMDTRRPTRLLYLLLGTLVIENGDGAFTQSISSSKAVGCHYSFRHRQHSLETSKQQLNLPISTMKRKYRQSIVSLNGITPPKLDQQEESITLISEPSLSSSAKATTSTLPRKISDAERRLGVWVLLTVPLAWGTFEPAVRYVYAIQPPIPGFVFSVGYYLVAAVTLAMLVFFSSVIQGSSSSNNNNIDTTPLGTAASDNAALPIRGGLELGVYLFIGNAFQVLGLKTVPSDRAAFLLQLTTIFVPLVQSGFAGNLLAVPIRTWIACVIALVGVAIISLDGKEGELLTIGTTTTTIDDSLLSLSSGDILIVLAAFSYTFHCIRLERFAKETSAVKLAACKAATETILCGLLVTSLILSETQFAAPDHLSSASLWSYVQQEGKDIAHFFDSFSNELAMGSIPTSALLPALGAVAWTGLVPVAYTIYAQSYGQSRVKPADANLIYTIQPICTAIFAWLLLGETLGPLGYLGGAIIGYAVYLVVGSDQTNDKMVEDDALGYPVEETVIQDDHPEN